MKISEQTDDSLVVEAGDRAFARILLISSAVCVAIAVIMLFSFPKAWRAESFQGIAFAAAVFLFGFLAVFERATFVFNRTDRTVTWCRRRAFSSTSGVVQFQDIRDVVLQTSIGDPVNPKRRVALLLQNEELPLSVAYAPDVSGSARVLAETLRKMIGYPDL